MWWQIKKKRHTKKYKEVMTKSISQIMRAFEYISKHSESEIQNSNLGNKKIQYPEYCGTIICGLVYELPVRTSSTVLNFDVTQTSKKICT